MKGWFSCIQEWVWSALVLLLPVTSMPLIIRLVKSDSVAAPSAFLLLVFILLWFPSFVHQGGKLSGVMLPFLGFVVFALFTTIFSNFFPIPGLREHRPIFSQLSALLTLAIGASFYLAFSLWPIEHERLRLTIRLVNWAGLATLIWATIQALAWYSNFGYPQWMRDFHEFFSTGPLNRQRVLGFTLEPSWLAHELNMLFLPLWLAASLKKFSWHKFRVYGFTFENLLLAGGVIILLLTLSRIGLLAFLAVLAYLLLRATRWASRKISEKMMRHDVRLTSVENRQQRLLTIGIFLGFSVIYLGVAIGLGWLLSRLDIRTAKLFQFDFGQEDPILHYAKQINIAARLVYWQAGWNIFAEHPWLGVGMGNAGFYLPGQLSNYAMGLMEVRQLLYRSDVLLNIKCLWVRILAETGIVGFSFFLSWFINLWLSGRNAEKCAMKDLSTIGLACRFACIALIVEGFSVDTFALPYIWILLGLATAANMMIYKSPRSVA